MRLYVEAHAGSICRVRRVKCYTRKVDKARVEKEVDTGAMPPPQSPAAMAAASVRLTYGQKQENKDKQAELDLETMYKEGLLIHSKAAPGTIAQQEAVSGQQLPATGVCQ